MYESRRPRITLFRTLGALPPLAVAALMAVGTLAAPPTIAQADSCPPAPAVPDASSFKNGRGEPNAIDNPYFPFEAGTTFVYRGVKDGEPTRDVVDVTHQNKMITGVPTTVVHDRVFVGKPLKLEEETFDWYAQDRQGNVWYFGEDSTEVATGDKAGSWEAGKVPDGGTEKAKPGILMEAHPKPSDAYLQENALPAAEDRAAVVGFVQSLRVPYGTFQHVLKTREGSCIESGDEFKYYAQGVGNIKVESLGDNGWPDGVEEQHLVNVKRGRGDQEQENDEGQNQGGDQGQRGQYH